MPVIAIMSAFITQIWEECAIEKRIIGVIWYNYGQEGDEHIKLKGALR
jgi:hypothetical protein